MTRCLIHRYIAIAANLSFGLTLVEDYSVSITFSFSRVHYYNVRLATQYMSKNNND